MPVAYFECRLDALSASGTVRTDYMTLMMRDKENRKLGKAEATVTAVDGIMKKYGAPLDDACQTAGVSVEEYNEAKELLEEEMAVV